MRLDVTGTPIWALTVAAALQACCGCTTLLTSPGTVSALRPAAEEPVDESIAAPREEVDRRRGPLNELLGELHRFVAFGDPKEMNSSQFDAVSDRQMKAMRAEIDGGSSKR
jgi:hypothetical protein